MKAFKLIAMSLIFAGAMPALATPVSGDFLVRFKTSRPTNIVRIQALSPAGTRVQELGINNWVHVTLPHQQFQAMTYHAWAQDQNIDLIQPNYGIFIYRSPKLVKLQTWLAKQSSVNPLGLENCPLALTALCSNTSLRAQLTADIQRQAKASFADNPAIPMKGSGGQGADPLFSHQWGMQDIGVQQAFKVTRGDPRIVVAVIDTGVDYTHEDLVDNIWHNPGETGLDANGHDKATNGIDDDHNGYVDDVIGWDFASNDNKPYDLKGNVYQGGNPGHGTHCAGNVAARGFNGKGITGVAPNVRIMPLRFITDQGQGTTAGAVEAIRYAVDNGARVTSNSWGSEGDDPQDPQNNQALHDAIQYAMDHNVLFVAAAGNGHNGVGYDNDTDSRPGVPASYDNANIISVAAIDQDDQLASFSNWGAKTVDIGAPGVKVFSTTVGNNYSDMVIPMLGVSWDGTSMATPHVAGAAALYWSAHPDQNWQDVKNAILNSAVAIPALRGKVVSNGKLNVEALLNQP